MLLLLSLDDWLTEECARLARVILFDAKRGDSHVESYTHSHVHSTLELAADSSSSRSSLELVVKVVSFRHPVSLSFCKLQSVIF